MDEVSVDTPNRELKFLPSLKEVVLHPRRFFETMPLEGGYRQPLIFAAFVGVLSITANGLVHGIEQWKLPLLCLVFMIGMFCTAALYWLLSKTVGGKGRYEATFRAVIYAHVALLISWIPYMQFPASIYELVLMFFGIRAAQSLSDKKTMLVVGIPYVIGALSSLIFHS